MDEKKLRKLLDMQFMLNDLTADQAALWEKAVRWYISVESVNKNNDKDKDD